MRAAITVPFLHMAFLTTAAIAAVVVFQLLPAAWRERRLGLFAAGGAGLALAAGGAALGLLPWHGELNLAVFSLFMIGGFVLAWGMIARRAPHLGIEPRRVADLLLIAMVLGIVGARARYVWERWDQFARDQYGQPVPLGDALARAADINAGGAVWYGGVLLATAGVLAACWRWRIPMLAMADLAIPATIAGLAIGRIGCFFNGCCFGAPCDLPWAVSSPVDPAIRVHPTQLYETVVCGLLAAGLWWLWTVRRRDGQVAFWGVVGYAAWRFFNESIRHESTGDDPGALTRLLGVLPGTTSQATSLYLVIGAVVVSAAIGWYRRTHPEAAEAARQVPGSRYAAR